METNTTGNQPTAGPEIDRLLEALGCSDRISQKLTAAAASEGGARYRALAIAREQAEQVLQITSSLIDDGLLDGQISRRDLEQLVGRGRCVIRLAQGEFADVGRDVSVGLARTGQGECRLVVEAPRFLKITRVGRRPHARTA